MLYQPAVKRNKINSVLHLALLSPGQPNACISPAFAKCGVECYEMDWLNERRYGLSKMRERLIDTVATMKPDLLFMQLQTADVIDNHTARQLSNHTKVINWTGDVRENIEWYAKLAPSIYLTLFTNMTDVNKLRLRGLRADYLQIGYDTDIYHPFSSVMDDNRPRLKKYPRVTFCGNNYSNFPLSVERTAMVSFMRSRFKNDFQNFGSGWPGTHQIPCDIEADLYRHVDIAINQNHFEYELFSSDRILRIMACGTLCMTRWFPGIEKEYKDGVNLVVWKDFEDLYNKVTYYLHYEDKRKKIAEAGQLLVSKTCTWENRINQLLKLIPKWAN